MKLRDNRNYIILLALFALLWPVTAFSDSEHFGEKVRSYLLSNPEVILEVFAVLEAQEAEMETASNAALVSNNSAALFGSKAPFAGEPQGSRVLVKFVDYRCGYCRLVHSTVEEAKMSDPDLKVIYKMFPILGPDSTLMAQMALAIYHELGQGAFLTAQDVFFAHQGPVSERTLIEALADAGLETNKLIGSASLKRTITRELSEVQVLARNLDIRGTPSFASRKGIHRGALDLSALSTFLGEEL